MEWGLINQISEDHKGCSHISILLLFLCFPTTYISHGTHKLAKLIFPPETKKSNPKSASKDQMFIPLPYFVWKAWKKKLGTCKHQHEMPSQHHEWHIHSPRTNTCLKTNSCFSFSVHQDSQGCFPDKSHNSVYPTI